MGRETDRAVKGGEIYTSVAGVIINEGDHIMSLPMNIARGKYPGASILGSFGERTTAGAEDNYPVWPNGPILHIPPAGGLQMAIVSTSANDSAAGTNVRTVEIHYLDVLLDPQVEVLIMNGITPVLTVATDIRFIQCMHLTTFGANAFAGGIITATNAGDIYSQIDANEVRCSSSFRMVPRGNYLYVLGAVGSSISGTAAARTRLRLVATELDEHQYLDPAVFMPFASIGLQDVPVTYNLPIAQKFLPGTVVGIIHSTDKAATISGSWTGVLEPIPV